MDNIKFSGICQCRKKYYAFDFFPNLGNSITGLKWRELLNQIEKPSCSNPDCKMMPNNSAFELIIPVGEGTSDFIKYIDRKEQSERRAKARMGEGATSKKQKIKIMEIQEYKCYFCLKDLSSDPNWYDPDARGSIANWDHLTPLTRGGTNEPMNMAFTCKKCNQEKSNRTEKEYWSLREKNGHAELNKKAKASAQLNNKLKSSI